MTQQAGEFSRGYAMLPTEYDLPHLWQKQQPQSLHSQEFLFCISTHYSLHSAHFVHMDLTAF